jgi:hypothetical protein
VKRIGKGVDILANPDQIVPHIAPIRLERLYRHSQRGAIISTIPEQTITSAAMLGFGPSSEAVGSTTKSSQRHNV